jgi:hypothetical protein
MPSPSGDREDVNNKGYCLPSQDELVGEHADELIEATIVIDCSMEFLVAFDMLLCDHLPLG